MFTFREKKILNALQKSDKALTVSELSEICNVTTRTIKSDIENIKKQLTNERIQIITKPRVGVWLEIKDEFYMEFEKSINDADNFFNTIFPEDRVYLIIKKLLEADRLVSLEEIAEQLYVSKSTVVKDFIKVEEFLEKYEIKLCKTPKHGTKIVAEEKSIRLARADIAKAMTLKHENMIENGLDNLLNDVDLHYIENILLKAEDDFGFMLSDISFKGLLIHITISIKRIKENKRVDMDKEDLEFLKEKNEWKVSCAIADEISSKFNIKIDEAEIGYITIHLAGAKLQNDIENQKVSEDYLKKLDLNLYVRLQKVLKSISQDTGYNFEEDKKLFTALFLHLRPAINRAKNNIKLDNPFLKDIKRDYSIAYEISVLTCSLLEDFYHFNIGEDEIGYVALHFGAAFERMKTENYKKAVLICATGIGTSQLLFTRFKKEFPEVEVTNILSVAKATKIIDKLMPDIVLSTVPFNYYKSPVVNVSPLLTKDDIEKIKMVISKKKGNDSSGLGSSSILKTYIDKNSIMLNMDMKDKENVLKVIADKLNDLGVIKEGFLSSVLEREKFSSTAIGNLVAIPHPYDGYVNKSRLTVATLKTPIKWGSSKVQLVFMIALDITQKKDFRKIFEELENIISDENKISQLINCNDIEKFTKILGI